MLIVLLVIPFSAFADTLQVVLPYDQIWTTNRTGADNTFRYRITPASGNPAAEEAGADGVYRFSLNGNDKGELTLHIPFPMRGTYVYRAAADSTETRSGYSSASESYDISVTVQDTGSGMHVASIVLTSQPGDKTEAMYFHVDYRGSGGEGGGSEGGGGSGGGSDPSGGGQPEDGPDPGSTPEGPDTYPEDPEVAGMRRFSSDSSAFTGGNLTQGSGDNNPTVDPSSTSTSTVSAGSGDTAPTAGPSEPNTVNILPAPVPLAGPEPDPGPEPGRGAWALFNLLCVIATALEFVIGLALLRRQKRKEDAEAVADTAATVVAEAAAASDQDAERTREIHEEFLEREKKLWKKRRRWRISGVLPAVGSALLFLRTEDIRLPMIWMDRWSIWMFVIFVIETGMFWHSRYKEVEEELDEDE